MNIKIIKKYLFFHSKIFVIAVDIKLLIIMGNINEHMTMQITQQQIQ